MMKSVICILLIFLATTTSFSQSGWISQSSGITSGLNGVSFTDFYTGTAVGNADVALRTTNGGSTWASQTVGNALGIGNLYAVSFCNNNIGTAVGTVYDYYHYYVGTIFWTFNGGTNWYGSYVSLNNYPLYGTCCIDSNTKIFVGNIGVIGRTTDGGASWGAVDPYITSATLRGVTFTDMNKGTIVGDSGIIFRTTNGGTAWIRQLSGTSKTLRGVSFAGESIGFVVGDSGIVLHTTNSGTNWIIQSSGTLNTLRGVSVIDANIGFVVGDKGTILCTTNGGTTWIIQTSPTINNLMGVSFINANTGTIVGDSGTILHTTTGGVTDVKDGPEYTTQIPNKFALKQNYPNPFNPSTNIPFHVQSKTFVSLKVFDLLGREVATLVSEELSAGDHIQSWNAMNISSGIYFYRLQAGSFIETKKLVLLR